MIGRHLCLHPVLLAGGVFPEDYDRDHDRDRDRDREDSDGKVGLRREGMHTSKRATVTAAAGSMSTGTGTAATGKQVRGREYHTIPYHPIQSNTSNTIEWVCCVLFSFFALLGWSPVWVRMV